MFRRPMFETLRSRLHEPRRFLQVLANEVKTAAGKGVLPGTDAFARAFRPHRTLVVGGDGLPLEQFFLTPVASLIGD